MELTSPRTDLISDIRSGKFRHIVIASGAGVSTSSGIPDYRSGAGWFAMFPPQIFTDRSCYEKCIPQRRAIFEGAQPTAAHHLAVELWKKGLLRRVYTQNIDGLYQKAGLPDEMLVEAHGNFARGTVVLYGEQLPSRFTTMVEIDFRGLEPPDIILVMGTSLQVAPFCALPNLVPKTCTRVLITRNILEAKSNAFNKIKGDTSVKFRKKKVSLKSRWGRRYHKRWPRQILLDEDVDAFSREIIAS